MGILQDVENAIETTESDVEAIVVDILKGAEAAAEKLGSALNWLASQAPVIDSLVDDVETMVKEIIAATPGAAQNATVTAAIADANNAVTALNAFATAANTGNNNAQAVVAGYVAYQQAVASTANAKAAVASTPAAAPAA